MRAFVGMSILGLLLGASTPVHAAQYFASASCSGSGAYDVSSTDASEACENSVDYPNYVEAGAEADADGRHAEAPGDGRLVGQSVAVVTDNYLVSAGPGLAGAQGSLAQRRV